jgi:hypothetical protein
MLHTVLLYVVCSVYLVRESTTVSGCFVLTMFAYGVFRNFQIQREHGHSGLDKFFIDDGPQFPSCTLSLSYTLSCVLCTLSPVLCTLSLSFVP